MDKLRLALDWTPNVNHIGFFVAKHQSFYQDHGIDLEILNPQDDNYQVTPAKKVEIGEADFALCPMESILSYQTKPNAFDLKAIAAIYKEDLSAIVCHSDIKSPRDLDGKTYASYKARYEDEIVKQMIINDGGKGDITISYPDKLGIWETIFQKQSDATWIFLNWEGIQADTHDVALNYFKMHDFNIPYSYSPVIAASHEAVSKKNELFKRFIAATKAGFLFAKNNIPLAAEILGNEVPESDQNIDLAKAIRYSSEYFGNEDDWGLMMEEQVDEYLTWIYDKKLESKVLGSEDLMTNELIK